MIIILSKRYKYLNIFGLLHLIHEKSVSNNYQNNKNYYLSVLFVSNIIYNYYIKNNEKDIIILKNYITLFIDCFNYAKLFYRDFYYQIIKYILKNVYLTDNEKEYIINKIDKNKLKKYYNLNEDLSEYENNSM